MPEQALGGIPLGFGIVVKDTPSELSWISKLGDKIGIIIGYTQGSTKTKLLMRGNTCVHIITYIYHNPFASLMSAKQKGASHTWCT